MKKLPGSFEDLMNVNHRWPRKGDRLLRPSNNWNDGVEFANHPTSRHALQWDGFMSAGAGLIELCVQHEYKHERHFVIYPILFNYRHGLELALKWIIGIYGGEGTKGINENHDLWGLWMECRAIVGRYGEDDKEAAKAVGQVIKDFHDLDKSGTTFRYGWSKDGKVVELPDHIIDLQNIRDVMEGVSGYFVGLDAWLDDLISAGP